MKGLPRNEMATMIYRYDRIVDMPASIQSRSRTSLCPAVLVGPVALAQRVEVDQKELPIMGSKSVLLRTLVAAESAKTADFGVPSSVPKWRASSP